MSREIAIRKKRDVSFAAVHGFFFFYMIFIFAAIFYGMALGIASGSLGLVAYTAAALLVWTWAFGSFLIAIPLSIYLNQHYTNKNYAAVDKTHSTALKLLTRLPVRKDAIVATTMSNLALSRLCQGYFESAESLFQQAIDYLERDKRMLTSLSRGLLYNNLGAANLKTGKLIEAELNATKSLEIATLPKNKKAHALMSAPPLAVLGSARLKLKEYDHALEYFEQAHDIYESATLPVGIIASSREQGRNMTGLGLALVYARLEKWEESEKYCDVIMTRIRLDASTINTLALEGLNLLANEYMNTQRFQRAEQLLEISYTLGRPYPFHPDARATLKFYEKFLLLTDRAQEIEDMKTWLREVHLLTVSN